MFDGMITLSIQSCYPDFMVWIRGWLNYSAPGSNSFMLGGWKNTNMRVWGTVPFIIDDVVRVILPTVFAKRVRDDVPGFYGRLTFAN